MVWDDGHVGSQPRGYVHRERFLWLHESWEWDKLHKSSKVGQVIRDAYEAPFGKNVRFIANHVFELGWTMIFSIGNI